VTKLPKPLELSALPENSKLKTILSASIRHSLFVSALIAYTLAASGLAWAVAPNDDFANRTTITGSSAQVTGDSTGATFETNEPRPDSTYNTLWWT